MEDIIDIIVTETTNTIEITSQATDEVIDVNIIDNRDDITLNVTPTLIEININSLTSNFGVAWGDITGTLANQTDLNTALGLKADLVGGKVPSSQLPSYVDDVVEVANYAALPATGETGKIYVVLDTNKIYRWSGSAYIEITDSTAVWGAITGTLSSQTDLQSALNAKFDDPTGDTTQYIAGDGSLITFPVAGQAGTLVREVRNTTGATLTKGTIVYISGATGNKPTVSKAIATGDSTSAQTFGMLQADLANNSNGYVVCVGNLGGLDTSAVSEGVQLYLSSTTAGTYTTTKQVAPAHLVYIGVVTRSHPTQGQIEVKIQNGYELDEIHDVLITSKANNDGLFYESSTSLWKNKSIATVLGYTPANASTYVPYTGATTNVDLGANDLTSRYLTANGASALGGVLNLKQDATYLPKGNGFSSIASSGVMFDFYGYTGASTYKNFSLRFDGLTDNTLRTLTIPNASGTIALTSNLSAYLPLSGGTLTGGLNGTFGNFSSYVNAQTIDLSNSSAANSLRITHTNTSYHAVSITATGGSALYATGSVSVIGTLLATGVISAQSGLANGTGQSFTFGTTSGTLAITSQLSSYLPLSGGTLTGALSGTSATFSGLTVENNQNASTWIISKNTNAGAGAAAGFLMTNNTGDLGAISLLSSGNSPANGLFIRTLSTNSLILGTNSTANLTIASGGAATFSSSITATNGFLSASYNAGDVIVWGGISPYANIYGALSWDIDKAIVKGRTGYALGLYSDNSTTGSKGITILTSGNVGIGTTSPGEKLWVNLATNVNFAVGGTTRTRLLGVNDANNNFCDLSVEGSNVLFYSAGAERMRITSGGNVRINTSSDINSRGSQLLVSAGETAQFYGYGNGYGVGLFMMPNVSASGTHDAILFRNPANGGVGSIQTTQTLTLYNTTSDYRLKEDLKSLNGLEIINKINVYNYKWKEEDSRMDGVLAHELQEVLPYAVSGLKDGDEMQGVDYSKIVPVMVQAIKDLKAELDTLKNK